MISIVFRYTKIDKVDKVRGQWDILVTKVRAPDVIMVTNLGSRGLEVGFSNILDIIRLIRLIRLEGIWVCFYY